MRPERLWAQSSAERKKNGARNDMIRERDNSTPKDYGRGYRNIPWKADGGGHIHSLTGDAKRARKNYYDSPTPPNLKRNSPREGSSIAITSPHDSDNMGRGHQQYGQWRGGWQEGRMGGKRPYGSGGDVVQCSSSSSMNETTKGKPQNRDGSMKSGREQHSASGYAPPPSNGTGVDGVRLHSKAGYDDGLRDGGGRNADQYIPRRDRKREVGEIVEDGEISYQVSDVPIAKGYAASLASEGVSSSGEDLIGLCHGSSFQGKMPRNDYNVDSMVTLKERTEKEDEKDRWPDDESPYPCERRGSGGGGGGDHSSPYLHNSSSSRHSQLHYHDNRVGSFSKRSRFSPSPYNCDGGSGGFGRESRSSGWEGEYHGGGESPRSCFHSSRQTGSANMQQSGVDASLQHKIHQSSSHQRQNERIGCDSIHQPQHQLGKRDSIIAEDGNIRFSGGHEKGREWNDSALCRRFDDGGANNKPPKNEPSLTYCNLDGPVSTTTSSNNSAEMVQSQSQHMKKEYNKVQHKRPHTDPIRGDGLSLQGRWNTPGGDGGGNASRKSWSQSGSRGDIPSPFQTFPKPPPSTVTVHGDSGVVAPSLSSLQPPAYGSTSSSSRVRVCGGGASNTTDAVVVPSASLIQERNDGSRMPTIKPSPAPCNQDPLHPYIVRLPPLPPPPCPEIIPDPLDKGRIELRSELDSHYVCAMQYEEVSFYFKVLGRRIEKLLVSR